MSNIARTCNTPLRKCRNCGYRYTPEDKKLGIENCPDCGTPRARCSNAPAKGREKCRFHGGQVRRGIAAPHYKGKGFSKYMTTRVGLIHDDETNRISAVEMKDQIDMIWSRMADLLARTDKRESGALWRELKIEFAAFQRARRGDPRSQEVRDEIARRLTRLEELITVGHLDAVAWDEILKLSEALRKTRQGEAQRRKMAAEVITRDQLREFVTRVLHIIKDEVKDNNERTAIYTRIQALQI